ncbi:MAG TPA: STAS domain-containing protein, partial [Actinomycetota bacterium]|nr:STAS domain-containing protein [Actinomycetota bacterium]
MELRLSVQHHEDRALIRLGGEVDLAACPQLRAVLVELVDRGFHQLTIDLQQVIQPRRPTGHEREMQP